MKIEIDIKGKKYTDLEINQMLCDYISIGENVYKRRSKIVDNLIKDFKSKYGESIIDKKRNLKIFLSSAKSMYKLAEFYLCQSDMSVYDKYIYNLSKVRKGARVTLSMIGEKKLEFVFENLLSFLEFWFIYTRIGYSIFKESGEVI